MRIRGDTIGVLDRDRFYARSHNCWTNFISRTIKSQLDDSMLDLTIAKQILSQELLNLYKLTMLDFIIGDFISITVKSRIAPTRSQAELVSKTLSRRPVGSCNVYRVTYNWRESKDDLKLEKWRYHG